MSNGNRNHRNQRNNPYVLDSLAVTLHRSAAGLAWRWRTELAILTATAAATWRLAYLITLPWAAVVVLVLVIIGVLPWTRRRFWCVLARHRIHRLCWEARLHTRSGRLPLVLWVRPTKVGERLHLLCRAGDLRRGLPSPHRRTAGRVATPAAELALASAACARDHKDQTDEAA